jgi:hypothetical protein
MQCAATNDHSSSGSNGDAHVLDTFLAWVKYNVACVSENIYGLDQIAYNGVVPTIVLSHATQNVAV